MGMMPDESDSTWLRVIYDGDCPFCENFMKFYAIRNNAGNVELIDARKRPALVRELRSRGMEINDGMIVMWHGHHYYGAEGMHLLSILGNNSGGIGMLNRLLFRNKKMAAAIYPLLAAGRRVTLALLRRKLIPLEIPSPPLAGEGKSKSVDDGHATGEAPLPPGGNDGGNETK